VPGFAVGVVEAGEAAAFGAEQKAGLAEDVREGEDEPGIFGDDVGGDEIDFGELVGDGASVDAAVGVDVERPVEQLGGGFDLDADRGGRGLSKSRCLDLARFRPLRWDNGCEMGGVEDDVVASLSPKGLEMPKPWRAAARAKASSEISPRRFGGEFAFEGE